MTERERWIVYPLLFLALGAALRDKIVKSTESQRIKCQGLAVFDANENPLLVLGAEQFPELRADAPNFLHLDRLEVGVADAGQINTEILQGKQGIVQNMVSTGGVLANKYTITDGQRTLTLNGDYTVQILQLLSAFSGRGRAQPQSAQRRNPPQQDPPPAAGQPADDNQAPTAEPSAESPSAAASEPPAAGEPAQD